MLAALENYRDETKKATARCIYAQQGPAGPNRGVMALINNGFGSGCRLTFFAQQSTIPDFKPCVPRVLSINDNLGFCGLGLTPGNFPLSFFFFFFGLRAPNWCMSAFYFCVVLTSSSLHTWSGNACVVLPTVWLPRANACAGCRKRAFDGSVC